MANTEAKALNWYIVYSDSAVLFYPSLVLPYGGEQNETGKQENTNWVNAVPLFGDEETPTTKNAYFLPVNFTTQQPIEDINAEKLHA